MAERRSLVEGVKAPAHPVDAKLENDFVFGAQTRGRDDLGAGPPATTPIVPRSPLSTRPASHRLFQSPKAGIARPPT